MTLTEATKEIERCTRAGWSAPGLEGLLTGVMAVGRERASCLWTPKEDFDALDALTSGVHLGDVAYRHRRSTVAVALRLTKGLIEAGAEIHMAGST